MKPKANAKTESKAATKAATKSQSAETGSTAGNAASQNAEQLLKADHRQVEQLFERYQNTEDQQEKASITREVCSALILHTLLEEEIFYPACREKDIDDDMLDEAQVEHDGAKVMITELMMEQPGDEFYDAKVTVLSEYIKHHVREEEKSDGIFAKARQAGVDMDGLGRRLADRKQQLAMAPQAQQPPSFRALQYIDNSQTDEEGTMNRGNYRERDEEGRFMSDDDRRSSGRSSRSRYEDDDDRRGGRNGGHGGWFGDPQGHSEASQRGWEHRDGSRGGNYSRGGGRYEDEDERYGRGGSRGGRYESDNERYGRGGSNGGRYESDNERYGRGGSNGGRGQGGWFGDSEGHSEASRRGWERGDHGRSGWYGDPEGHSEASRRGWEHSDHRGSGWYGDPEGHSEASRRGWEHGHGGSSRSGYSSRGGRYEDDDDGYGRGGSRGGRGRGGRD